MQVRTHALCRGVRGLRIKARLSARRVGVQQIALKVDALVGKFQECIRPREGTFKNEETFVQYTALSLGIREESESATAA